MKNYKRINGTSAGFYGISEYIVFSTIKNFIEVLNKPQKFECKPSGQNLYSFELKRNGKTLTIFHSSSLNHFPDDAKNQLFIDETKLRAPDIAILKEENGNYRLIAAIEIKNYLDKGSTNSAIKMLSQIQKIARDKNTKYAIFSSNGIFVGYETNEILKNILLDKNTFLIINREKMQDNKKNEFNVIDLSQFLDFIKKEIEL